MTTKEATIINYEVFIPILKKLPYTHRYWLEFRDQYFPDEPEVNESVATNILAKLDEVLAGVKLMTPEEFEDCECEKKPCLMFHDHTKPIIMPFSLIAEYREQITLLDDSIPTFDLKIVHENDLTNPLIIEQHYLYGGIKRETRYTDETKQEIETIIEEV